MLSEGIAHTLDSLIAIINKSDSTVKYALNMLHKYGLIDVDERGYISITNWLKYQDGDVLARRRMKDADRQRIHREKKKLLLLEEYNDKISSDSEQLSRDMSHAQSRDVSQPCHADVTEMSQNTGFIHYNIRNKEYKKREKCDTNFSHTNILIFLDKENCFFDDEKKRERMNAMYSGLANAYTWITNVQRATGKSEPDIKNSIGMFCDQMLAKERWNESLDMFKEYFVNWLKKNK